MLDIIALCREVHVPYATEGHHHCHEGWVQIHCPFCGGQGFHLGFSLEHGNMNCWRCGKHTVWQWLRELFPNKSPSPIIKKYSQNMPTGVPKKKTIIRKRDITPPPQIGPLQKAHIKYLTGRGFDAEKLSRLWSLQGAGALSLNWTWRIIAPMTEPRRNRLSSLSLTISFFSMMISFPSWAQNLPRSERASCRERV